MNAAQRQIEAAAVRAKAKGLIIIGYRPASTALAKHPDGSLVLTFDMMKQKVFDRIAAESLASTPISDKPVVKRGIIEQVTQGSLL